MLAGAQNKVQQIWPGEVELNFGFTAPLFSLPEPNYEGIATPNLNIVTRYNWAKLPMSTGTSIGFYGVRWMDDKYYECGGVGPSGLSFILSQEYNFRRGKLFSPYLGLGLGYVYNGYNDQIFLQPKAGIELLHTFRLNAWTAFGRRDICSFGLSLGFVIGGYPCSDRP